MTPAEIAKKLTPAQIIALRDPAMCPRRQMTRPRRTHDPPDAGRATTDFPLTT